MFGSKTASMLTPVFCLLSPNSAIANQNPKFSFQLMQLKHTLDSLYDTALALLFPQACALLCGASVEHHGDWPACAECWRKTHIFSDQDGCCWKCGRLARGVTVSAEWRERVRCGGCDTEAFTLARAVGLYEGALRQHVLKLKHEPYVGTRLAKLLFECFTRTPLSTATCIIPVPLHPERERVRGFNQAVVLGRSLAARARLPLDESSLIRTSYSEQYRAGMDGQARRASVSDAFSVQRPRLVENQRVLLIDDVFTTGATASMCAGALRVAGASEVFVLTVAQSGNQDS